MIDDDNGIDEDMNEDRYNALYVRIGKRRIGKLIIVANGAASSAAACL
jgi:hypothetical protein